MTALLARYRLLPTIAGAEFLPIAFLARLPSSMAQIGTVLLVSTTTGSIALAGVVAGALGLGTALGGPVIGHLADRHGQRRVIAPAAAINAVLIAVLVLGVHGHVADPLAVLLALGVGASTPQIGPLVRSRWISLTGGGPTLSTAMSYEGAADEVAYVLGPALISLLAAVASPAAAVLAAAALVGVFGVWVGLHPSAAASAGHDFEPADAVAIWRNPVIAILIVIGLTIGTVFGGLQTGVAALTTALGHSGSAGLVYSVMAVGSAAAALATSALPARFALPDRLAMFAGSMTLLALPLLWVHSLPGVVLALVVLGATVGPTLITVYSLSQDQIRANRTGATMTLLSSGISVGYLIGSTLGGRLAQGHGSTAAFAVSICAIAVGAGLAIHLRSAMRVTNIYRRPVLTKGLARIGDHGTV